MSDFKRKGHKRSILFSVTSSHLTGVQGSNVSPDILKEVTAILWNRQNLLKNLELYLLHKISNIYKIPNSNTTNYHKNVTCATLNFMFLYQWGKNYGMCRFRWLKVQDTCEIWDSNSSVAEDSGLLESCRIIPDVSKDHNTLKTSGTLYQMTQCNIPEDLKFSAVPLSQPQNLQYTNLWASILLGKAWP
jgi:hypothetical protein